MADDDYGTVEEIRDELRKRDLPVSGTRDELIARLEGDGDTADAKQPADDAGVEWPDWAVDASERGELVKCRRPDGSFELVGPDDDPTPGAEPVAVRADYSAL
jgi:hypothetical protein